MTVAGVFAALMGILKAIPIFDSYFKQFVDFYFQKKIEEISTTSDIKKEKVRIQWGNFNNAKTIEEKAIQFSILNDLR